MLDERSKYLRRLVIEMVEAGGRGHIGPAASVIEIIRVLYDSWLEFRPNDTRWSDRDRFILSKGHGCLALYAVLADKNFFPLEELSTFCKTNSRIGGHPEVKLPGIEASTGALGHGLPIGVGMALAAKIRRKQYRVAVLVGDGEINEGSVWEAAMSASKHKLENLTVFVDYNKMQSYGSTLEVMDLEPLVDKWISFGFDTFEVDGHDVSELERMVSSLPSNSSQPTAVVCHTIKGKGFPIAESRADWHHKTRLSDKELTELYTCLD
jgi:transketolase